VVDSFEDSDSTTPARRGSMGPLSAGRGGRPPPLRSATSRRDDPRPDG
jgi:hypothetical protein